jgi:hypothetical protein
MNRRSVLSLLAGATLGTGGCITGGRVAMERNTTVTIQPERGWWASLPDVGGNGALSVTIRAEQPFDVYYFTSQETFDHYRTYVQGGEPEATPRGHRDISQAALSRGEEYGVKIPADGGRKGIDTSGEHFFVVDHSNYGTGVPVERYGDPLQAFVDLRVIDKGSPL